ncbi:MAG: DNA recombination protein RmuC [Pseudomonadota bacterium]
MERAWAALASLEEAVDPVAFEPAVWMAMGAALCVLTWAAATLAARLARAFRSDHGGSEAALARLASDAEQGRAETLRLLEARLQALESLSGQVLSLQDILANKQARGAFGEIQLADVLRDALPPSAIALQATLSNGRRVDALLRFPAPPGPLAVDAKFPLEAYEALREALRERDGAEAVARAERRFRQTVRAHVTAVAERYVLPGETAEGALMFIPSEAVFAEIHSRLPDVVREGFGKRVWMVSPTTLMATLTTLRGALREVEIHEEAAELRREMRLLASDVRRLHERSEKLRAHLAQADEDLREIGVSASKSLNRARRLEDGGDAAPPPQAAPSSGAAPAETRAVEPPH